MPFTPAHAAAALPFRRTRLVLSAVVVGTLAPDFEYYLRLQADGRFGHTLWGVLFLTLPLALGMLWIFHAVLKRPAARLLPEAVQRRLADQLEAFRFGGAGKLLLIIASILIGIATHIFWDSFTHSGSWFPQHSAFLRQHVPLPLLGSQSLFRILQHFSTLAGLAVLSAWLTLWYGSTQPRTELLGETISPKAKALTWAALSSVAFLGALGRAFFPIGIPRDRDSAKLFLGNAVVTGIAMLWWELVLYGIWTSIRNKAVAGSTPFRCVRQSSKIP